MEKDTVVSRVMNVFYNENLRPRMNEFMTREEVAEAAGFKIPANNAEKRLFLGSIQSVVCNLIERIRDVDGRILCAIKVAKGDPIRYGFSLRIDALAQNYERRRKRAHNAVQGVRQMRLMIQNLKPGVALPRVGEDSASRAV